VEEAVAERELVEVMAGVTVEATAGVTVEVTAVVTAIVTVSPPATAMAGAASRSALAAGPRSLHPAASIARVRQPDDCPPRHLDGRTHQVG